MYSLEVVYRAVERSLPSNFTVKWVVNKYYSSGVIRRLIDAVSAIRHQSDVNHVIGDVHYLVYFLRRNRTILTIHDFVRIEQTAGLRRFVIWFLWYWLPVKRTSFVVVISNSTKNQLHRYLKCDPAKVRVIHNPVSDGFHPSNRPFGQVQVRVLHVGTGSNKNLQRHAQALRGIDCQLVVLGVLNEEQQEYLRELDVDAEVHSQLSDDEVVMLYQSCDLLLFASTYEGFGMPIVEAQATGIPVITSKLWSMPEVAGTGALFVDPYDVEEIRGAVDAVASSTEVRQRLVDSGFRNVERFRSASIAFQYANLYQHVADEAAANNRNHEHRKN